MRPGASAFWLGLLLSLLWLTSGPVSAQDQPVNYLPPSASVAELEPKLSLRRPDRATTSGLGIGAGLGSDNVWLGGHVIYYQQLPNPKLRIAFHVGAGFLPWPNPQIDWGVRGGSFFSYGTRHRLLLGLTGGTMSWETFGLHYRTLASQPLYGAGLSVGYELMTDVGVYLRVSLGPALVFGRATPFTERDVHVVVRGNLLTLGYKLW